MSQLPAPTRHRDQANRDMAEHGYALIADALSPAQVAAMTERLIEQAFAESRLKGAVPGLVGFFGYNAATTGSAFELPFRLLDSADTVGLGLRRTLPNVPYFDFTLARGFEAARTNVLLVLSWTFGSAVLVALGVYGLTRQRNLRGRWVLLAMALAWPLGYLFFWGSYSYILLWDGGRFLGPYYYLPILVPLVIAGGVGFDRLLHRSKPLVVLACVLMVCLTVPTFVHAISVNEPRTDAREAVMQAVRHATAAQPNLIILPAVWGPVLQHPFSFLRNAPDYDGRDVYALDIGPETLAVVNRYADRHTYVMSLPDNYQPRDRSNPRVWVDRAALADGRELELTVQVPEELVARDLVLRIGSAFTVVAVPFGADGRAMARIAATSDGITLRDPTATGILNLPLFPRF